jgi:hypothetical protein
MAKKLIQEYVFNPGLGLNDNTRPNAVSLITQNRTFIIKEISAYIQNQIDASDPDYVGKTYDIAKCERDSGYVIDALIYDLRYGGNEETRHVSAYYWNEDVPQIAGNRVAEIESYTYARDLINNYILTNTLNPSPEQAIATQVVDTNLTAESNTDATVTSLLDNLIDVITNGLTSLNDEVVGLGRIEVLGKIELEDILIITNVTDNVVIYNFADDAKGGTVSFSQGNSPAYPRASSVNEGTTIINFYYNTASMSTTDNIQIFFEESELKVRLADISMDAMERVKIGKPQAMLDADFEYGLQPTKWQAIATERGYPSVYEIPASDIEVLTVTTDASSGSNDVGASLITVTTVTPHEFEAGDAFTIRALSSSIIGFNRAEGTFVVNSVSNNTSFTYYAKSKVGSSNGQLLATTNTQLRRGGFYTGSKISDATFTIPQQGASGSFTTTLQSPDNSGFITFTGTAPQTGVVVSGTGIDTGTQVSGVFGSTNVDGVETTKYVANDFTSGATTITLTDVTGIIQGMAVSNAAATPEQRIITSINGNQLVLNGPITTNYTGDSQQYTNLVVSSANYVQGTGTGATFDVSIDANLNYSITGIAAAGSGYATGDTLLIPGTSLGGTSPTNDITLNVFANAGAVVQVEILSSTTGASQTTYNAVSSSQTTNTFITNATLVLERDGGSYSFVSASGGANFKNGHKFTISGTDLGGTSPTNDATVVVLGTSSGAPNNFSASGTAIRGDQIDIYSTVSLSTNTTAQISSGTSMSTLGIARVQVVFADAHGLLPGAAITVTVDTDDGVNNHALAAGPFFVQQVVNDTTIQYDARSDGTIDLAGGSDNIKGQVYVRPDAFFTHRPFDGGVKLGTGSPQHGNQAIRMSKKYIRYQSGKGAMYNTGALFAPSFDISSMTATGTAAGSVISIQTDDQDHGLQSGSTIRISGAETVGYNGDLVVTEIVNEREFKATSPRILGDTTATLGSQCQMSTLYWHGAVVRSGCFDDQNGIFWQYDGQIMAVGRRTSTFQCAGSIAVDSGSNTVTGTGTRFLDQLQEGDRIVLKGMTHVVANINSNTSMTINPGFRGVSDTSFAKISKVQDIIIPQNEWNLDRCDGTGPSGYLIDVTKMQMIGVQFTWYGAGFIDWMLRGPDGNYIFCHREKGNNVNTEAYMRTGNLPVRYEVLNEGAKSRLSADTLQNATVLLIDNATDFPTSGVVQVGQELISYTGKDTLNGQDRLTGCTRSATLTNFAGGSTRSYTGAAAAGHDERSGVVLISGTTSPIISHWGSAYLIDGEFDEDRGYIFNYAENNIEVSTTRQTAFLLRLAPSVSNAIIGDLGERELLNRAQLLLQGIEITSNGYDGSNNPIQGGIVVEGVINPKNYPLSVSDISWSGLSTQAQGGQPSFAQVAAGGSVNWSSGVTQTETAIDWQDDVSTSSIGGVANLYTVDARGNSRDDYVYLSNADIESRGIQVGMYCTTIPFNGARITSIGPDFGFGREVVFDRDATNEGTNYGSSSLSLIFEFRTERSNSSIAYFTATSWENSGATTGTAVSTSDTNWPAGTVVSSVNLLSVGGTDFYEVTFNNASNKGVTLNGTTPDTVTMLFGQPPFALPGETVFSFVAQPGERATLDLSGLKELTTTTLGGRGTFPNGPDVLAINVYKVAGTATNANVLLRWGEAQA